MKETILRSEIFTVYVEKATAFSACLSFNVGIAKILILFDLFSNFLDWVAGIVCMSAWPVSAQPHIGWAPKPHSPTAPQL